MPKGSHFPTRCSLFPTLLPDDTQTPQAQPGPGPEPVLLLLLLLLLLLFNVMLLFIPLLLLFAVIKTKGPAPVGTGPVLLMLVLVLVLVLALVLPPDGPHPYRLPPPHPYRPPPPPPVPRGGYYFGVRYYSRRDKIKRPAPRAGPCAFNRSPRPIAAANACGRAGRLRCEPSAPSGSRIGHKGNAVPPFARPPLGILQTHARSRGNPRTSWEDLG